MKNFSLSFNGALIKSKVQFAAGTNNIDRPMQGQSPYLINTGLFYNNTEKGWNAAILYNRIGKRIIGVGNRYGSLPKVMHAIFPTPMKCLVTALTSLPAKSLAIWK